MTLMTVLEFAAYHVESQPCTIPVKAHVDMLVKTALDEGRALWMVVTDPDGTHSLLWTPLDVRLWEVLLDRGIEEAAARDLERFDAELRRSFPEAS